MSSELQIGSDKIRHILPNGDVLEGRQASIIRAGCSRGSVIGTYKDNLLLCCVGASESSYYLTPLSECDGRIQLQQTDMSGQEPKPIMKKRGEGRNAKMVPSYLNGPEGIMTFAGHDILTALGELETT